MEKKIEELEKRIVDLEAQVRMLNNRPMYHSQPVYLPPTQPYPYIITPTWTC